MIVFLSFISSYFVRTPPIEKVVFQYARTDGMIGSIKAGPMVDIKAEMRAHPVSTRTIITRLKIN